jgi:hypothetical protein
MDGEGSILGEGDPVSFDGLHGADVGEAERSGVFGEDKGLLEGTHRSTTGVEGTHRELRSGLADGLSGDDADGLTDTAHLLGAEVEAVALGAAATLAFAGEDGANLELLDADLHEVIGLFFSDELVRLDDDALIHGIVDGY